MNGLISGSTPENYSIKGALSTLQHVTEASQKILTEIEQKLYVLKASAPIQEEENPSKVRGYEDITDAFYAIVTRAQAQNQRLYNISIHLSAIIE